jgi:hypothetical protein
MVVEAYLGSQCTKFHASGWMCWFLRPFIWRRAISLRNRQSVCNKFCANLEKIATYTLAIIRQAFGEEVSHTWVFEWHAQFRAYRKRRNRWRTKSSVCSSCSLTTVGWFTKNSFRQAKQLIPHTTVTVYGNCVKMCKDFCPNSGDRTGCYIMTMHRLTLPIWQENFWPKTKWLSSPTILFCFPIEDETERTSFWHNWGDWGRFAGSAEHPHRTCLMGCI